ncbi:MAG: Protocatechuate 3,4-dioxygenase beta chain, partial [uncultured Acetobacteraceae bacterium]
AARQRVHHARHGVAPARAHADLQNERPPLPPPAAVLPPEFLVGGDGAGFRAERAGAARQRPPPQLRAGWRRADRGARHPPRPRAGRQRAPGAERAGGGVAGQRRRPLPPPERPLRRADRPQLRRLRPHADGRRRALALPHGEARPLPLPQPAERLAAGAHALLRLRLRLRAAPHHPDVLRRRPAAPPRRHHRHDPRPGRAGAPRRATRPWRLRAAAHAGLPLGHRAARPPLHALREQVAGEL